MGNLPSIKVPSLGPIICNCCTHDTAVHDIDAGK